MIRKKLRIVTQFKTPMPLMSARAITVMLPYANGQTLSKGVNILDAAHGLIEITLTDFEMDGLKVADGQHFRAEVQLDDGNIQRVVFYKGLNIAVEGERKVWR